ncbi:MAG: hypothetical protein N2Z75_08580 [Meiothermus sp.]|uniref:hypothetical protein n=1 Tax=Meiothermus sp. TaxID=1955249 RepID=UPI0025F02362|nr:hypothetical protein [Meiothermus sp.]MCS7068980.1 hypothetical protein [Meiothermus sp.]MCX7601982.1 hypothetical protein [Meiothermus sp.]MDW8424974.1 hypothetical protein [Meiothermus sp.]
MYDPQNRETGQGDLKPDWKDFIALVIAAYSILLPPLLMIIGAAVLVLVVLFVVF